MHTFFLFSHNIHINTLLQTHHGISNMFVYMLVCTDGSTYIGATVDLSRRLRQHNGEIAGGAKRTTSKSNASKSWTRACYVSQFPDWSATLQFEWRWKHLSRKYDIKIKPLERRMNALKDLLALERPTSKALAYTEWSSPPEVHCEIDESKIYFDKPIT